MQSLFLKETKKRMAIVLTAVAVVGFMCVLVSIQPALADGENNGRWQQLPPLTYFWERTQLFAITKGPRGSTLVVSNTGHSQWVENGEVTNEFMVPEAGAWDVLTSVFWDEAAGRLIIGDDNRYWDMPVGAGLPVTFSCTEKLKPWQWVVFSCPLTYPLIEHRWEEYPPGSVLGAQPKGNLLWFILRDQEQNYHLSKIDPFLPGQQRFTVFDHLEARIKENGRWTTGEFDAAPWLVAGVGTRDYYVAPIGSFSWPTVVSDNALLPLYSYDFPESRLGVGDYTITALAASRQTQEMVVVSWEAFARWNVILVSNISGRLPVSEERIWVIPDIEEPIKVNDADIDARSILIGTDYGLYHIDRESGQVTLYTVEDGLPSNQIIAVLADGDIIWAAGRSQAAFLQLP